MARIPESTIDEIRDRSDIVDVISAHLKLQKRGADFWACCPFHKEKTPSFKVSPSRQSFYCFGCGKGGNVFTFLQEFANLDFLESARTLARRIGLTIPEADADTPEAREAAAKRRTEREQALDLLQQIAQWFHHMLSSPQGGIARDYVASRGLDSATVERFGLGYAPDAWEATLQWVQKLGFSRELAISTGLAVVSSDNPDRCYDRFRGRLMFPIHDTHGRVVGFSGRVLDADAKTAKYVNSPETDYFHKGRILYGLHLARQHFRDHGGALVCEGQLDVIACHRAGLNHAVCAQGTAFTEHHARLLQRLADSVTLAFDADSAGQKAALSTILLLHRAGIPTRVVSFPPKADPDSLFQQRGPAALQGVIADAVEAIHFVYRSACETHDAESPQGKSDIVKVVMPAIASLEEPVARAAYCTWLAAQLKLPESAIQQALHATLNREQQQSASRGGDHRGSPGGATNPAVRPQSQALPPFTMPDLRLQALVALLDLALHYHEVATRLCDELPPEAVTDDPVGKAINLVLASTMQGEWSTAATALARDQDVVSSPAVARVLVGSEFDGLDPAKAPQGKRQETLAALHRATEDCLRSLSTQDLTEMLSAAHSALAANPSPEEAAHLLGVIRDLQRKKHDLK